MKKVLLAACAALLSVGVFSQTILDESFDGTAMPDGWTMTSTNTTGWIFGSPASLSSQYWAIPAHDGNCAAANDDALGNTGNSANDRLITPSLDLSTLSGPALSFDAFLNGSYGSTGSVLISTDGGTTASALMAISIAGDWQSVSISLADYADETDVKIIFRHSDNGAWADGLAIDNVSVFSLEENTANFIGITTGLFANADSDVEITGIIQNMGSNPITSADISWVAGSQTGSATIDGLDIGTFESYEFTHPDLVSVGSDNITVDVTINTVNSAGSASISNATQSVTIAPLLFLPNRKVFIEEATGTWCGWCPRGAVNMDLMDDTYPNSIEVAVHNGDPMTNTVYDNGIGTQIGGYPSGLVDRAYGDVDPSEFEDVYLDRIDVQAIVSVAVETEFDEVTRVLNATITATFAANVDNANFRINSVLVEDNVTGTGSGWGQVNYYANNANGPMGGYENLPSTVPASQMVYRHVGREIFGGWNGTTNTIPGTVVAGEEYTHTYTYTVPTGYDESELSVVGLVINQSSGQIMNAEESGHILSSKELATLGFDFNLYPNPATAETNIALNIEKSGNVSYIVYDMSGKRVAAEYKGQLAPGEYLHTIDVSNFVTINIDDNQLTRKLAVK